MQFYFIRHAQSLNNHLYAETGSWEGRSEDPDLTELGWQQAEYLAGFLSEPGQPSDLLEWDAQNVGGFPLTHLYCSLMVRAVATGMVVSQQLDLPLVAWLDAHETGGIHDKDPQTGEPTGQPGRNRVYFETHYPQLVLPESLGEEGWWNRPFETREQRPERARRFLADLLARHGGRDDQVAVISHGGFYNYVLRALLGLDESRDRWFSLNNCAVTRIAFEQEGIQVHYMNRLDFMPRELIT
jgi:2,3-bisphosphoglycerate-dependent phosphoglycerate mutase